VWLETGSGIRLSSGLPAAAIPIRFSVRRLVIFTIGIDPHKGSHLAAALNEREQFYGELRVRADRHQRDRLLNPLPRDISFRCSAERDGQPDDKEADGCGGVVAIARAWSSAGVHLKGCRRRTL
jgi:hypothetical protein